MTTGRTGVTGPRTDRDVPRFVAELGIPALVDVHTHFMPETVMAKVWAYFDRLVDGKGRPLWPITYRGDEAGRLATLAELGVGRFTSMVYPHKPGMAEWLNGWAGDFAAANPACALTFTFFPEPGVDAYVAEAVEGGARVAKVHLQVGAFDPRDRLLAPVWRRMEEAGTPVVIHAGSGPEPGPFTGPGPIGEVLEQHPELVLVLAHMGGPEYAEFLSLALRHPHVHLDTTMAFTDFMEALSPFPPALVPTLAEHPERVVLGSDFPNIPHPYAHQLTALVRLGLGDDWLRAVCHDNGARLLGPVEARTESVS
jgi:uncharacterized protein